VALRLKDTGAETRGLELGRDGATTMTINATYMFEVLAATARMLVIGILHVLRVISLVAFFAVGWWLAMVHHSEYDFLTWAKIIVPFWAAMMMSRLLLDAVRKRWRPQSL
jgi:hypothetical protein